MSRIIVLVIVALLLSACGLPSGSPQASSTTASPVVSAEPTHEASTSAPATATPDPSPVPLPALATVLPEPTSVPATAPPATVVVEPEDESVARAYVLMLDGVVQAWNPNNGEVEDVGRLPADARGTVSPDGSAIAFVSDGGIFIHNLESGESVDITPAGIKDQNFYLLSGLRWSPDSQHVLFDIDTGTFDAPAPAIYRGDRAGSPAEPIISGLGPMWSPDGRTIAYAGPQFELVSPYGGGIGGRLMLAAADGEDARAVGGEVVVYPQYQPILWSRDGSRVAAVDVVVETASGEVVTRVPEAKGQVLGAIIQLAPNGQDFGVWRSVRMTTPNQDDPYLFDELDEFSWVAAGSESLVLRGESSTCPCMPLAPTAWVAWQSDGTQALVNGAIGEGREAGLHLLDTAKGTMQVLADEFKALDLPLTPDWSPDSRYALITSFTDDQTQVWVVPLEGGEPTSFGAGVPLGWSR